MGPRCEAKGENYLEPQTRVMADVLLGNRSQRVDENAEAELEEAGESRIPCCKIMYASFNRPTDVWTESDVPIVPMV